jgi:hypothetical protein
MPGYARVLSAIFVDDEQVTRGARFSDRISVFVFVFIASVKAGSRIDLQASMKRAEMKPQGGIEVGLGHRERHDGYSCCLCQQRMPVDLHSM